MATARVKREPHLPHLSIVLEDEHGVFTAYGSPALFGQFLALIGMGRPCCPPSNPEVDADVAASAA